jgi:hypothetical protein
MRNTYCDNAMLLSHMNTASLGMSALRQAAEQYVTMVG